MPAIPLSDLLDELDELLIDIEIFEDKDMKRTLYFEIRNLIREIFNSEDYLIKDQINYIRDIDRSVSEKILIKH